MICELIKNFCGKREKIKVDKSTVETDEALFGTFYGDYTPAFRAAVNEVGIKEYSGENQNPRIIEYHKACELKAKTDEIAWCSAFVNWCMLQVGEIRTESAAAISWTKWGKETNEPRIGDIVVFRRTDSSWRGHVGFYVAQDEKRVLVLGGNQRNEVSFQWYQKKTSKLYLFQYRSMR